MSIHEEQFIAHIVMDALTDSFARPIVAGGAARDWYRGNTCNDIDIYAFGLTGPNEVERRLRRFNAQRIGEVYDGNHEGDISAVYEMDVDGKKVQVMSPTVGLARTLIARFPVSSSQVIWRGWMPETENEMIWTRAFYQGELQRKVLINTARCSVEFQRKSMVRSPEHSPVLFHEDDLRGQRDFMMNYF